jgi:hypothetical protein
VRTGLEPALTEVFVSSHLVPPHAIGTPDPPLGAALSDVEYAILRATRNYSMSTVAVADAVGLGGNLPLLVEILQRLERLNLVDGFFAAGCASAGAGEVHRRYYRATEIGRRLACATA